MFLVQINETINCMNDDKLFQLINNLCVLIIQIYLLYRCNIIYNKFFSLSIFYQLVRIAPRSSPGAAPAYVGIVVLVGGGGGGGVVVAPAVVAKIARPAPAFAVGRIDAASRPVAIMVNFVARRAVAIVAVAHRAVAIIVNFVARRAVAIVSSPSLSYPVAPSPSSSSPPVAIVVVVDMSSDGDQLHVEQVVIK